MSNKTFPEFDPKKHVITVDKVPEWVDPTCYIEERNGRTYVVSRQRVRRWKVWRDWWRRHPGRAQFIRSLAIVACGLLWFWPAHKVIISAGVQWTGRLTMIAVVWGFLMGWEMRGSWRR